MEPASVSYQIKIRMFHDQQYTYDGMFSLYLQVMNQDRFCLESKVKQRSFERTLRAWVSLEGSWLIKTGRGENARFYKCEPEDKILKLINRGKSWIKLFLG